MAPKTIIVMQTPRQTRVVAGRDSLQQFSETARRAIWLIQRILQKVECKRSVKPNIRFQAVSAKQKKSKELSKCKAILNIYDSHSG
jgi:hypothetical protein